MRAANLEVLTGDVQARYGPGVTVWGKGDLAHQKSTSDHNEDDTPGSKSEQQDADNIPEHRGLDIPYLGPFSEADADDLRVKLITRPANQVRLRYVIQRQTIWRKKGDWKPERYNGEYHGHLHISSDVADDNNRKHWDIDDAQAPSVPSSKQGDHDMNSIVYVRRNAPSGQKQVWALAGAAAGPGGWVETSSEVIANGWAGQVMQSKGSIDVDFKEWDATAAQHRGVGRA